MKVVHFGKFYAPHRGGMETMLAALCQGLAKRGVECEVVVSDEPGRPGAREETGIHLRRLKCLGVVRSVPMCPEAPWALRGVAADVIHIHHPNPLADACLRVSEPEGRIVVTYHSDVVGHGVLGSIYEPLARRTLELADAIAVSSAEYAESSPVLPDFREKWRVIPYGIDCPEVNARRAPFSDPSREPQYLFLGRLVPYKGVSVLIRAMRRAPGRAWIAGSGPLEDRLRREAAEAGVADRVEFLGSLTEEEKWKWLEACDVLVLPSVTRAEAFGIVLLEAMAMGRPVVVSDLPTGIRALVQDGVNGRRFAPGDDDALAEVLKELAADPRRAWRMGEEGARMVREYWTTEQMVERYLGLYHEVTSRLVRRAIRQESSRVTGGALR